MVSWICYILLDVQCLFLPIDADNVVQFVGFFSMPDVISLPTYWTQHAHNRCARFHLAGTLSLLYAYYTARALPHCKTLGRAARQHAAVPGARRAHPTIY